MTRLCGEGEFKAEKVCCHEAFARTPEKRPCHIPWAHLEWLKLPRMDADLKPLQMDPTQRHEASSKKKAWREGSAAEEAKLAVQRGNARAAQLPKETKMYCFRGKVAWRSI